MGALNLIQHTKSVGFKLGRTNQTSRTDFSRKIHEFKSDQYYHENHLGSLGEKTFDLLLLVFRNEEQMLIFLTFLCYFQEEVSIK